MTDTALAHLTEQLEAYFPDGCFVVGVRDGECEDPIVLFRSSMQYNNLNAVVHEVVDNYFGPFLDDGETVTFEADGDWLEDDDEE